jgi:lysophospholipase L1-like esterase
VAFSIPYSGRIAAILLAASTVVLGAMTAASAASAEQALVPTALPHVASILAQGAPLRVIAFGSSSTEGAGASSAAATYPARLQGELRAALPAGSSVTVLNRGVGGEGADDMMRRLPKIIAEHPSLVIWQTGSNDPLKGVPLERFIGETRRGIDAMRAAAIDVMLMTPQDCPVLQAVPGSGRYRDALRTLGAELGVPVIRRFDLMREWLAAGKLTRAQLMSHDELHMTDGGYALLARAVSDQILAAGGPSAPAPTALVAAKSTARTF